MYNHSIADPPKLFSVIDTELYLQALSNYSDNRITVTVSKTDSQIHPIYERY